MRRYSGALAAAVLALLVLMSVAQAAERRGILIGTASPGGIYYALGGAVCRLFNLDAVERDVPLRCDARISAGSVENVAAIGDGSIDAALIQSDVLADAIAARSAMSGSPSAPALRAVLVAHDEPFSVIARAGLEAASSADLTGKRISIGEPGSGHRFKMERVMRALDMKREDFALVLELDPIGQLPALCDARVDAIVYSVGHPSGLVQEALGTCRGRLLPVVGSRIDAMIRDHAEYAPMVIPGALYPGAADTPTFGTRAILVASDRVLADTIYTLTKSVFGAIDDLHRLHPAFESLVAERMAQVPAFAPVHEGAARYYRERGWIK
jgi:uncharacterized protein